MSRIICPNCSREYNDTRSICPDCGHDRSAASQTFAPSLVTAGPDPQTGDHVVTVADLRVRSESRRAGDGSVLLKVAGATGVGRPGEARLAHTLRERLVRDGYDVQVKEGDDSKGVDRILVVNKEKFLLQVTIAPQSPDFWQDARHSSATTQVSPTHAMSWLYEAVKGKKGTPSKHDAPVVLAIDVRHAGAVVTTKLLQEYLVRYGSRVLKFGFASVWIVGPTADYCCRLGDGRP